MKKFIKYVSMTIMATALMFALAACSDEVAPLMAPEDDIVFLEDSGEDHEFTDEEQYALDNSYDAADEIYDMPNFGQITGEVTNIEDNEWGLTITIVGENGTTNFTSNEWSNTLFLGSAPAVGDTITGFHVMEMFMLSIYPPQHPASVIVNHDFYDEHGLPFITVDRFYEHYEGQLISADGQLVVNIGDDTNITLQDGEVFDGELEGRMLVVTYYITTRSLPPQALPEQIIVLFEQITTGPAYLDDYYLGVDAADPHYDVVINGVPFPGPMAIFVGEDAIFPTHVELAPVALYLTNTDTDIDWNDNAVTLEGINGTISFILGEYDFILNGETVTLNQPSVGFYGNVFVPILFFRDVFGMGSAYSQHGVIYLSLDADDMY